MVCHSLSCYWKDKGNLSAMLAFRYMCTPKFVLLQDSIPIMEVNSCWLLTWCWPPLPPSVWEVSMWLLHADDLHSGLVQRIDCTECTACFVPHCGVWYFVSTMQRIPLLFPWTALQLIKRCDWQVSPRATPDQPTPGGSTLQCWDNSLVNLARTACLTKSSSCCFWSKHSQRNNLTLITTYLKSGQQFYFRGRTPCFYLHLKGDIERYRQILPLGILSLCSCRLNELLWRTWCPVSLSLAV